MCRLLRKTGESIRSSKLVFFLLKYYYLTMILSLVSISLNSFKAALIPSLTSKDLETNYFPLFFHLDSICKN